MAPIVVISSWVNHPELIATHSIAWKSAFLGESVEYIVYIDAVDAATRAALVATCRRYGILFRIVPQRLHLNRHEVFPETRQRISQTASGRAAVVCQLAWLLEVVNKPERERVVFTQSDVIPFREVQWSQKVPRAGLYYKAQERSAGGRTIDYAWDGLIAFDLTYWPPKLREIVSFDDGSHAGVFLDVGGGTWKLLRVLPPAKRRAWTALQSEQWSLEDAPTLPMWLRDFCAQDPRVQDGRQYGELLDDWAFHLRTVSNWDRYQKEGTPDRFSLFIECFKGSLDLIDASTQTSHRASGAPQ